MLREFFCAEEGWQRLWAWVGLIIFVGHQAFRAYVSWRLNGWYESFYDMLQTSIVDVSGQGSGKGSGESGGPETTWEAAQRQITLQLLDFVYIVSPSVFIHPVADFSRNWWVFQWRVTLMTMYLKRYNMQIPALEGTSQRIHEDTQRFAAGVQGCVAILLHSLFTLLVFCPTLYALDPQLMYVAIGVAFGGILISALIGWPLVGLEVNNQKVEAEVRKQLVIVELQTTTSATVTNFVAKDGVYTPFVGVFGRLRDNYARLYVSFAALGVWLSLYEQAMAILPYALAGPRLFVDDATRRITLGQLMKITNSFARVFDSLNVISDNWLSINEFRSTVRRLREFEREQDTRRKPAKRPIEVEISPAEVSSTMSVENVVS
jgi:peptide/bleomycin uptake transporter